MTSVQRIDPSALLPDQLAEASPDVLRELMSTFIQALMSAEADAVCGGRPYAPKCANGAHSVAGAP